MKKQKQHSLENITLSGKSNTCEILLTHTAGQTLS